ncbi:MAG: hypothetical protein RID91_03720 [Azospirillaceae bacterium]
MTPIAAILAIALFAAAFRLLGVWPATAATVPVTRRALAAMTDAGLDDDAKERAARAAALDLARGFVRITGRAAVALALPAVLLLALDATGIVPVAAVSDFLLRWEVILAAGVAVVAAEILSRRAARR